MHILEVSISGTVGSAEMGPVSTDICELSNNFVDQGHDVTLVDVKATLPRDYLDSQVEVVDVDCTPDATVVASSKSPLERQLQLWRNTFRYLRKSFALLDPQDYDIVHVHGPRIGYVLHRFFRQPYILTCHTPRVPRDKATKRRLRPGELASQFKMHVERQAVTRAELAIALGDYLRPQFPEASIVTIPNGVDPGKWTPVDKQTARSQSGIDDQDFVVVFTGRIHPVKGVDVLIKATSLVAQQIKRLRVFVIGSLSGTFNARDRVTPYAQQLLEDARGLPIEFLGFINNSDPRFARYLAGADIAVVPSIHEPQGKVVLEALAMGTPVVGSDTGGIGAMLNPRIGRLVPPGDADELAATLLEIYQNPERRHAMARACRAHIEAHWSWRAVAGRHLRAFTDHTHRKAMAGRRRAQSVRRRADAA